MLTVEEVEAGYLGSRVLTRVSLKLEEGELVCLLGANGAGKSTLLKVITGLHKPTGGRVLFRGEDITHTAAHRIAAMGIVMVPEGRRLFPFCTVMENLELGGYARGVRQELLERVFHMFPRLEERKKQLASTLSGGEQQMLTFGRAMMARPEVLLMDEPSLGLAPLMVKEIFGAIETIHRSGVPILLVEQNAARTLAISDRGYIMETGKIVLEETSVNLRNNPLVLKAYLGGEV
jgi:branched-chain amino acid transport system ATP-binding protein